MEYAVIPIVAIFTIVLVAVIMRRAVDITIGKRGLSVKIRSGRV